MILAQKFKTSGWAHNAAAHRQGCADDAFKRGFSSFRYAFRVVFVDGAYRVEKTRVK